MPDGTSTFGKDQQLAASLNFLRRLLDEGAGGIISNVSRQTRATGKKNVVSDFGFHDARNARQPGGDEQHVYEGRMVGCDDQPAFPAQRVEFGQVASDQSAELETTQVEAKAAHDDPLAQPCSHSPREAVIQERGRHAPRDTYQPEQRRHRVKKAGLIKVREFLEHLGRRGGEGCGTHDRSVNTHRLPVAWIRRRPMRKQRQHKWRERRAQGGCHRIPRP